MNGLKKQNLSKQQKIVYIVMISGLLLLITANIFAWLYLQRLKTFFISDLKFRLENIARSASELIEDFLIFARSREPQYQDVRVDNLISRVKLGFLDFRKFTIQTEIKSDIEQIETDPDMLEQILLNVIQNSFQATSGSISMSSREYQGTTLTILIPVRRMR